MSNLTRSQILTELNEKYVEWREDLGLSVEEILMTLLEVEREKNEWLVQKLNTIQKEKAALE